MGVKGSGRGEKKGGGRESFLLKISDRRRDIKHCIWAKTVILVPLLVLLLLLVLLVVVLLVLVLLLLLQRMYSNGSKSTGT